MFAPGRRGGYNTSTMMRAMAVLSAVFACAACAWAADERPLETLPHDVADAATVWTEPVKAVQEQTRRFDPVSGLALGLIEGSVASVERAANLLRGRESSEPARDAGKLFRYSF